MTTQFSQSFLFLSLFVGFFFFFGSPPEIPAEVFFFFLQFTYTQ